MTISKLKKKFKLRCYPLLGIGKLSCLDAFGILFWRLQQWINRQSLMCKLWAKYTPQSQLFDWKQLVRPPIFSGRDQDFESWKLKFVISMSLLNFDAALQMAALCKDEVPYNTLRPEYKIQTKYVYSILANTCQGRALNIVRLCITPTGEFHGLEAWRRLLQEYEPTIATRAVSQLSAILTPLWSEDSFLDQWRQ